MAMRPSDMQEFIEAGLAAFGGRATDTRAAASLARIRAALEVPGDVSGKPGERLPVCDLLGEVAAPANFADPDLRRLADAFGRVEPRIAWRRRGGDMTAASANIAEGHANGLIVGPGGVERRRDVWLGVSLLAPHVRYPDHNHAPEETYLVMSEGEFRHGESGWFNPGVGGTFYNEPGIEHAMRTEKTPLLAFWALWAGDA